MIELPIGIGFHYSLLYSIAAVHALLSCNANESMLLDCPDCRGCVVIKYFCHFKRLKFLRFVRNDAALLRHGILPPGNDKESHVGVAVQ